MILPESLNIFNMGITCGSKYIYLQCKKMGPFKTKMKHIWASHCRKHSQKQNTLMYTCGFQCMNLIVYIKGQFNNGIFFTQKDNTANNLADSALSREHISSSFYQVLLQILTKWEKLCIKAQQIMHYEEGILSSNFF